MRIFGKMMRFSDLHEEIERQFERFKISNEASNGIERAKIESHNDNLRVRKLRLNTSLRVLTSFEAPSREDQPGATLG